MAGNIRVLDCRIDELEAHLNAIKEDYEPVVWNFYHRGAERRVTVVMGKLAVQAVAFPPNFDPRKIRQN